ncbi:sigma-70 family RNA polymerase sigma factor [Agrobacterium deltaense]
MHAVNDNSPRNPEFDRKLLAYQPALRKLARRIAKHDDAAEELFQQAMLLMLRRHTNCRIETFWTWASFCVRNAAQEHIKQNSAVKRSANVCSLTAFEKMPGSTAPSQEDGADLFHVISLLNGRSGKMVLRLAMGETLEAIGKDYGIGKERVRQLVVKERLRVQGLLREAA